MSEYIKKCKNCLCTEPEHMETADRICQHPDNCRGFKALYGDEVEELMDTSGIAMMRRPEVEKRLRAMLIDAELDGFKRARKIVTESFSAQSDNVIGDK